MLARLISGAHSGADASRGCRTRHLASAVRRPYKQATTLAVSLKRPYSLKYTNQDALERVRARSVFPRQGGVVPTSFHLRAPSSPRSEACQLRHFHSMLKT